ncbi:hypothetical protein GCM10022239_03130 [Leifsonia bigeumensis]|uniref:Lipocalin-like domain-containing protein n=1 Tax=Leifsonella bigeumensis TaxID=433643 RepID=A0ABP7F7H0_9MICO
MRASRAFAASCVALSALLLSSCALLVPPKLTVSDLVGTWNSNRFDATLILRKDMTFDVRNVPVGYTGIDAFERIGLPPVETSEQERVAFSGTWEYVPPDEPFGNLIWLQYSPGSGVELYLEFGWVDLDHLYLMQGDPDNGDFLEFFLE